MARGVPRGTAYSARIRAARAFADLDRADLGAAIGVSERQVTRLESGEAAADRELREAISRACGVPSAFLEIGFTPLERPITDVEQRVHELQDSVTELSAGLAAAAAELALHATELQALRDTDRQTGHPEAGGR